MKIYRADNDLFTFLFFFGDGSVMGYVDGDRNFEKLQFSKVCVVERTTMKWALNNTQKNLLCTLSEQQKCAISFKFD